MAEPLRKLVFRELKAKAWLDAALAKTATLSANVGPKTKDLFLRKIMRQVQNSSELTSKTHSDSTSKSASVELKEPIKSLRSSG